MQLNTMNIFVCLLVVSFEYRLANAVKLLRVEITVPDAKQSGDPNNFPILSHGAIYMSDSLSRAIPETRVACYLPKLEIDDKSLQWNKTTWDKTKGEAKNEVYCTSGSPGSQCIYQTSDGRLELDFKGFKGTDEANYTCSSSKHLDEWKKANVEIFYESTQAQTSLIVEPSQGPIEENSKLEFLKLTCEVVDSKYQIVKDIKWYFNNKPVDASDRIEISKDVTNSKNSSLTIKHPLHTDAGVYMCVMNLEKDPTNSDVIVVRKWTNVWSKGFSKVFEKESKNVMDGDDVSFCCSPDGHPMPTVTWEKDGKPILDKKDGGDERFTLTVGCKDSPNGLELSISKVNFDDKGDYDCVSKNRFDGEPPRKMALRVKDKLAALWPFLGIVAEVIILCTIIFLYERHQKRKQAADEDLGGEQNEQRQALTSSSNKANDKDKVVDGTNNSAATTKA